MSKIKREEHLDRALLRAAKKMMAMARSLESLGAVEDGWGDSAVMIRAEAALAYEALHKEFD